MSLPTFARNPAIFSFQRSMVITDGAFFNLIDGEFANHPINVVRHGIRGTQNLPPKKAGDTAQSADRGPSNIQQIETAKTSSDSSGMVVTFGLRMLDLKNGLVSCAAEEVEVTNAVRASVRHFIERAQSSQGLREVACRIARNIANGSWLWRNRVIASNLTVQVYVGDELLASFDGFSIPTNVFDNYSDAEIKLANVLVDGLTGNRRANIEVRGILDFGLRGAVEVIPSQVYLEEKPSGFGRALYKLALSDAHRTPLDPTSGIIVMGQAALRDQKISNRLRCIDTWYSHFEQIGQPLPIEPNGASLEFMQFFRRDTKSSAFDLFKRLNKIDPGTAEGMYCIAVMIRGGVFGESAKEKKGADDSKSLGKSKLNESKTSTTVIAEISTEPVDAPHG